MLKDNLCIVLTKLILSFLSILYINKKDAHSYANLNNLNKLTIRSFKGVYFIDVLYSKNDSCHIFISKIMSLFINNLNIIFNIDKKYINIKIGHTIIIKISHAINIAFLFLFLKSISLKFRKI
jgi:hypothetical protein